MHAQFHSPLEASRTLFRRCVQCPNDTPVCPSCKDGETCQLIPQTCDKCQFASCISSQGIVASPSATPTAAPSSGTNPGVVAGPVVGGLFVAAILTFIVWKICIGKRQRRSDQGNWQDYNLGSEKDLDEQQPAIQRSYSSHTNRTARSTYTGHVSHQQRASVASSAHTRASNVIPIAYIPGVTQRSEHHSTNDLAPPMPPIPAASPTGSPQLDEQGHYFVPRSLHDSYADRDSMARASIASTIYRNNAIVSPVPAQMLTRAKPTAVSVRSTGTGRGSPSISRSNTPPVPVVPTMRNLGAQQQQQQSSIVGRAAKPKPVQITKKSSKTSDINRSTHSPIYELDGTGSEPSLSPRLPASRKASDAMSPNTDVSESDDEAAGHRLVVASSSLSTDTSDYLTVDPMSNKKSTSSLNQIIEEAALKASRDHAGNGHGAHEASPFSDENAVRTP